MKSKKSKCREYECDEEPFSGGRCKVHAEEYETAAKLRSDAVLLLDNRVIDSKLISNPELLEEIKKLSEWWRRACNATNYRTKDPVLLDEAEYAVEWCIDIARELLKVERAFRSGDKFDSEYSKIRRDMTWDRFRNLGRGLMSNGNVRTSDD